MNFILITIKLLIFIFISILFAISCSNKINSEPEGVRNIAAYYGGKVVFSEGVSVPSGDDRIQGRYYEIILSGVDESVWSYYGTLDLPASNCAYLLYHSLSLDEKKKYEFVRIRIKSKNASGKYDFPVDDLAQAEKAEQRSNDLILMLKKGRYNDFMRSRSAESGPASEWIQQIPLLEDIDNKYGRIKSFNLHGFNSVGKDADGKIKWFVRLSGVLIREKQNTAFSLIIDPTVGRKEKCLHGFDFKKNTLGLKKIDAKP